MTVVPPEFPCKVSKIKQLPHVYGAVGQRIPVDDIGGLDHMAPEQLRLFGSLFPLDGNVTSCSTELWEHLIGAKPPLQGPNTVKWWSADLWTFGVMVTELFGNDGVNVFFSAFIPNPLVFDQPRNRLESAQQSAKKIWSIGGFHTNWVSGWKKSLVFIVFCGLFLEDSSYF